MSKVFESLMEKNTDVKIKQKRGRKPKLSSNSNIENISILIELTEKKIQTESQGKTESYETIKEVKTKKSKTKESKSKELENIKEENIDKINEPINHKTSENTENTKKIEKTENNENKLSEKIIKKRGRKPKGGKIIQQPLTIQEHKDIIPSIILHLKCSLNDLYNNDFNKKIEAFDFTSNKKEQNYDIIENFTTESENLIKSNDSFKKQKVNENTANDPVESDSFKNMRIIWTKLKELEHNLHTNNMCDKKSACFWCTYDFDNPPIHIPKHFIKESYNVYGCFCSPECAVAYLMEESIDNSSKFERYFLLNHLYSKIFNYAKNIKPAPNPKFMLEKYYGNLTIQEYRALFKSDRLFLIMDKPLTRILPELHEDNDDFIINNKVIPSNTYQMVKNQKKQTKNNIINEKFGPLQQI